MFSIMEYLDELCDKFDNDPDDATERLIHEINVALGIEDDE